jgi:hypothetical protein
LSKNEYIESVLESSNDQSTWERAWLRTVLEECSQDFLSKMED